MKRMVLAILGVLGSLTLVAQSDLRVSPNSAIVSIWMMSMDIGSVHGITANTCISVRPDGHFHFETRFQQLPNEYATLNIYEGFLDEFHLQRLQTLVESDGIRDAPPLVMPRFPLSTSQVSSVNVRIPRQQSVQKIGYFEWKDRADAKGQSYEPIPKGAKETWRGTAMSLIPLVQWFREIEATKMVEVSSDRSSLCDVDSEPAVIQHY